jgi:Arc/MetJ-type ribon-helix-helix transcriptional regulator
MGVVQLPEDLQRAIEEQVALGRAVSTADYIAEAVARMIADDQADGELDAVIAEGLADAEAGRGMLISSREDAERLHEAFMQTLRDDLAAGR